MTRNLRRLSLTSLNQFHQDVEAKKKKNPKVSNLFGVLQFHE